MRFGTVPKEVPVQRDLALLAPYFRDRVLLTLADVTGGPVEWPFETLRTPERQAYLYGFGRDYDDGRGAVTKARSHLTSWHGYGLAIDVVEKDATPWDAPESFWLALGQAGERHGLVWGGRWKTPDRPHLQWASCPVSPTQTDMALLGVAGMQSVWDKYAPKI